jgi:hypothetical protein
MVPVDVAYRNRLESLQANDADSQFKLGLWCAEKNLEREARRHLEEAVRLNNREYAERSGPYLKKLVQNQEKRAVKALIGALSAYQDNKIEEGAAALNKLLREYADTQIVRRPELQRDLISRHFKKLAASGADSIEKILGAVADRAAAMCEICKGSGAIACPDCGGDGKGACPICAGKGVRRCPVCLGSCRLTCPECYGRGKIKAGTIGYGMRTCPVCKGVGEVLCDVCKGTARISCKTCGGSGKIPGTCASCRGTGKVRCTVCQGSGIRRVDRLVWGPPPVHRTGVVNVSGAGKRFRVWQGGEEGAVITVVPSELLWRGALAGNLARLAGTSYRLVAVGLDNRKGKRLLRFKPANATVRGVTDDAGQLEILDLANIIKDKVRDRQSKAIFEHCREQECLPGAYVIVLAVFAGETDLAKVTNLFWVQGQMEPVKLGQTWFSTEEVEQLRKSIRKK